MPDPIAPPAWPDALIARGAPLLAALVVLIAALPGLLLLPPLDRDEARFAQSTAQMLESGDFVNIRFQDDMRAKKPAGINWLQALGVQLASSVERRQIWAYRMPSLASAMLAAAACAWGAAAFFGPRRGLVAGVVLGASFLLSSEAMVAKADAALCAGVVVSMAALARIYSASRGGDPVGRPTRALFWIGQALAMVVKGPVGPAITALTLVALGAADRDLRWLRTLGWRWGLLFLGAVVGPWAVAITVSTDGRFWAGMFGGDIAPKLVGGRETHGMIFGLHTALAPVLLFPSAFLLPAALVHGWRAREQAGVRFALAWLAPAWLVLEIAPTKLVHYPLPLYGALAWLAAAAIGEPWGRRTRQAGAAASLIAGAVLAVVVAALCLRFGAWDDAGWAAATLLLCLGAAGAGAAVSLRGAGVRSVLAVAGLGVAAHLALSGLVPGLDGLWVSQKAAVLLARNRLDPRNGVTPGPVVVVGYGEPSLVFALGTETDLTDPAGAADAVAYGQPALVEQASEPAFRAALIKAKTAARMVGMVSGYDYSDHKAVTLRLWCLATPLAAKIPAYDLSGNGSDAGAAAATTPGG
ncbi:MAG: ArnT family glycosyltransferase [Caulobacteraceae bacterium]